LIDEGIYERQMKKGFKYTLEEEKIIKYLKLSTEEKLRRLEEICEFNRMILDERE
jgi:hypothetical protein